MSALVLDASAAANFLLPDEDNTYGDAVLAAIDAGGALVPTLWSYEVGNLLLMAVRRKRIDEAYRRQAGERLVTLRVAYWDAAAGASLVHARAVHALADEFALSYYDAAYLLVARAESLPLATLDAALRRAAGKCGVRVFR